MQHRYLEFHLYLCFPFRCTTATNISAVKEIIWACLICFTFCFRSSFCLSSGFRFSFCISFLLLPQLLLSLLPPLQPLLLPQLLLSLLPPLQPFALASAAAFALASASGFALVSASCFAFLSSNFCCFRFSLFFSLFCRSS